MNQKPNHRTNYNNLLKLFPHLFEMKEKVDSKTIDSAYMPMTLEVLYYHESYVIVSISSNGENDLKVVVSKKIPYAEVLSYDKFLAFNRLKSTSNLPDELKKSLKKLDHLLWMWLRACLMEKAASSRVKKSQ